MHASIDMLDVYMLAGSGSLNSHRWHTHTHSLTHRSPIDTAPAQQLNTTTHKLTDAHLTCPDLTEQCYAQTQPRPTDIYNGGSGASLAHAMPSKFSRLSRKDVSF